MANKYKIKASGGQHTVQTVDATNTNTILGVRAFPTQELFARVVGGAIDIETQSKEIKVFIGLAHGDIITENNAVWGADVTATAVALNAFFKTSPHQLEDLGDVPVPVTNKFLKYVNGTYVWAEADGGSSTLDQALTVTNTIGDAEKGDTYSSGTAVEVLMRDMLAPFLIPSIGAISIAGTGASTPEEENLIVECGLAANTSAMTITFNNPESLFNGYPLIIVDTTTVGNHIALAQQSITDYGALNVPYVQSIAYSSPGIPVSTAIGQRNIRLQVAYQLPGTNTTTVLLKTVHIKYRHRFYVITSTASTVSSVQDLLTNATSTITSTLLLDPSKVVQSLQVQCNNNTENNSTFTWILIPGSGTLGEVAAQVIGKGVANYTDSWTLYDNSGSGFARTVGTAVPTYKAYRSNQPGAFDDNLILNLELKYS